MQRGNPKNESPGSPITQQKMATKKILTTGRFGVRYGKKVRQKVIDIEKKQKGWQKCPHCRKNRVKRVAKGIWQCRSCGIKFAGRAYEV